jgi:hypothetical protein
MREERKRRVSVWGLGLGGGKRQRWVRIWWLGGRKQRGG